MPAVTLITSSPCGLSRRGFASHATALTQVFSEMLATVQRLYPESNFRWPVGGSSRTFKSDVKTLCGLINAANPKKKLAISLSTTKCSVTQKHNTAIERHEWILQ